MSYYTKYYGYSIPSHKRTEFRRKISEIKNFCKENNITYSGFNYPNIYHFTLNGIEYCVSNSDFTHRSCDDKHDSDKTVLISAGRTRIIDIYKDLKAGYKLDKRGFRQKAETTNI